MITIGGAASPTKIAILSEGEWVPLELPFQVSYYSEKAQAWVPAESDCPPEQRITNELLKDIIVELKLISTILNEGLNTKEDLDQIRDELQYAETGGE